MPRVTAILVVQDGARWLESTLDALAAQSRRPDAVVLVAEETTALDGEKLAASGVTQVVAAAVNSFGDGITRALRAAPPHDANELIWLLRADTAPAPDALQELLVAVELAPSLAIAGPKLVDPAASARIRSYGESMSRFGTTVVLVDDELDQAQYDPVVDVLAVAVEGSLVRREVWAAVDGLDPGLPSTDAGLDLGVRVRLAGHRVVRVPAARVTRGRRPEDLGRRRPASQRLRYRLGRTAQLHRRFVYAPLILVPLHWLSLLPLALIRVLGQLLAKRPAAVPGEILGALVAAFDPTVPAARSRLRRGRRVGWRAVDPLRIRGSVLREHRANERDRADDRNGREEDLVRATFLGGGSWTLAVAVVLGIVVFGRLLGSVALEGGALLPLSADAAQLWSRLGSGLREIGVGFTGAADPANWLWALVGSLSWWSPSFALVALWLAALPLAALGAWWAATRLSEKSWPPVAAALLWMLAPGFLASLAEGRIGAVLAHLLLPWLALALLEGARSWSAAAAAALLFAATVAAVPSLLPALLLVVLVWALVHPRGLIRLIGVPIPAVVLFAPLAIDAFRRGSPLALLADPGPAQAYALPSGWDLLLARPADSGSGWEGLFDALGIDALWTTLVPASLLLPIGLLALASLAFPGAKRAVPALVLAALGLATAWVVIHLQVASSADQAVAPWPGGALSLYWLGLVAAAVVAVDALGRAAVGVGVGAGVATALAVGPLLLSSLLGVAAVQPGDGRILPPLVSAAARVDPGVGTLVLTPLADGSLGVRLERGEGATLDDQSALFAGRTELSSGEVALAELAGNLASRGGFDPVPDFERFRIGFVLVTSPAEVSAASAALRERAVESLDATSVLSPESDSDSGTLWAYAGYEDSTEKSATRSGYGWTILTVQGGVLFLALLLALPTRRRRRVVQTTSILDEPAATTFDEDSDD